MFPAVNMEGDPDVEEVLEALNAANNNRNNLTKSAKLFNSLVSECQVRVNSKINYRDDL